MAAKMPQSSRYDNFELFFRVSLYFHIFFSLYISTYNSIDVNDMHARSLCSHAHDFVINFLTVLCTHFSVALKGEK